MRLVLPFGLIAGLLVSPANANELRLKLENVLSAEGTLMVSVVDAAAFDGQGPPALQAILPARAGTVRFATDALPPGEYAIRAMHDLNGNGEMDSNLVGVPTEPWGVSNNARGNFGPPKFEDARFVLQDTVDITIRLEK
jgi:uncharacterized protein (DUF2141 family)